ncbi:MAG TPA: APC family permease [Actinoplanes sp.]|nr:APC family permease [Actinoplanes sp.]
MTQISLARKSVGGVSLWLFQVGASAPLTVVAGSVVATYASTGVVGLPLSFLVLAVALAPLTVGYVAMSRHVPHPAIFYGLLARGLGGAAGVAAGVVALFSYNAIQLSLYGIFGVTMNAVTGLPWWLCALLAWGVVAVLGLLRVDINATFFAWALIIEIAVVVLLDVASFADPAGGSVSFTPLHPDNLFVDGLGGVLALGIAAFVGYESGPAYAEEARNSRSVAAATFGALGFVGLFYALSSWALANAVGPDQVASQAAGNPDLVMTVLGDQYGSPIVAVAVLLLMSSIVAAMISFHNGVARYVFGMAREHVLPRSLARIGTGVRSGAPTAGSLLQSSLGLAVIVVAAAAEIDPLVMFTWLATIAALGVLVLLIATSLAAWRFFHLDGRGEGAGTRRVAPLLGGIFGVAVLAVTVRNLNSLLGAPPGSWLPWILPVLIVAVGLGGLAWGLALRSGQPATYAGIGHGQPDPLATPDQRLAELEL